MKPQVKHTVVNRKHFSIAATACPESPSGGMTPTITSKGSFQLSSNTFQNILRIPFSPPPLPSSGEFFHFFLHTVYAFQETRPWLWALTMSIWISQVVQHYSSASALLRRLWSALWFRHGPHTCLVSQLNALSNSCMCLHVLLLCICFFTLYL